MANIIEIKTERLKLRQWKKDDWPLLAKMNADPDVMKYFPATLNKNESNKMAQTIESLIADRGWGFWAVEITKTGQFIGFVGLHKPEYDLPVKDCVEIGWRLGKEYWGHGYATEAAKASLAIAFERLKLSEVYSFTSKLNKKSRSVMDRLGMINTQNNFEHPMVPKDSPLREHVLYRISNKNWTPIARD